MNPEGSPPHHESDRATEDLSLSDKIKAALEQINRYRPGLETVLNQHGGKSIADYSREVLSRGGVETERTIRMRGVIADAAAAYSRILEPIYGEEITGNVRAAIMGKGIVNTASHHSVLAHPDTANDLVDNLN